MSIFQLQAFHFQSLPVLFFLTCFPFQSHRLAASGIRGRYRRLHQHNVGRQAEPPTPDGSDAHDCNTCGQRLCGCGWYIRDEHQNRALQGWEFRPPEVPVDCRGRSHGEHFPLCRRHRLVQAQAAPWMIVKRREPGWSELLVAMSLRGIHGPDAPKVDELWCRGWLLAKCDSVCTVEVDLSCLRVWSFSP